MKNIHQKLDEQLLTKLKNYSKCVISIFYYVSITIQNKWYAYNI